MPDYLAEQARFWAALAKEVKPLMALRLYTQDYEWGIREYMQAVAPDLRIEGWSKPFYARMRESRLCIATYNSTTYLETLAANFPTLVFWNPGITQLKEDAIPYFEQLRSCGILHYTPESAARKLNQIYDDPQEWWHQPEVQEARGAFCEQYARTSPNWLEEWKACTLIR
jgi:putative transferase (TIGR04331 family)